jgi:hypothetical protein
MKKRIYLEKEGAAEHSMRRLLTAKKEKEDVLPKKPHDESAQDTAQVRTRSTSYLMQRFRKDETVCPK